MTRRAAAAAAGLVLAAATIALPAFAASENQQGQGQAIVTVLPGKDASAPALQQQNASLKVNGKESNITRVTPLGPNAPVELVVLIDSSARASLGNQLNEISQFIQSLPPNVSAAVAYMQNGQAALTGPLSTDRAEVARGLRLTGMVPGSSASPYFCLSDLAKHWPSTNAAARREVVMLTDGVDYYDGVRRYDPNDPYVQAAVQDAVRARLIVYSIYWENTGRLDRSMMVENTGQNLLITLTSATGGASYWQGYGDPVNVQPYLADITRRLNHQYEVSFMAASTAKPQVESFRLKMSAPGAKIDAPEQVLVTGAEAAGGQE